MSAKWVKVWLVSMHIHTTQATQAFMFCLAYMYGSALHPAASTGVLHHVLPLPVAKQTQAEVPKPLSSSQTHVLLQRRQCRQLTNHPLPFLFPTPAASKAEHAR